MFRNTLHVLSVCSAVIMGIGTIQLHAHTEPKIHTQDYPAAVLPDRVVMNLTATPHDSVALTWRTSTAAEQQWVQFAEASHGPEFKREIREVLASTESLSIEGGESLHHSVVLEGLEGGKSYVYRVGSTGAWTEFFQFSVKPADEGFSFIYFGDAQNQLKQHWSRVIREAYATLPSADFILHAGDLVNKPNNDWEWGEWFGAGGFIHAMIPSVMTPGNHEYKGGKLAVHWRPQFTLPMNGPQGAEALSETCYYTDYGNMRLICMDSMVGLKLDSEEAVIQRQWLDRVLAENRQKWTCVFFHHPLFASSTWSKSDKPEYRKLVREILDKHHVDLVLQGHDHGYGRGMVYNLPKGEKAVDAESGTVYVVSVSGPKMYNVGHRPWASRVAEGTQLFQTIEVEGETLRYVAYTATGSKYDGFTLEKVSGSRLNKITEHQDLMDERVITRDGKKYKQDKDVELSE